MSVGGIVVEVKSLPDGRTQICTTEPQRSNDNWTCIKVDGDHDIQAGDSLWWQGSFAYWTKRAVRDGADGPSDVQINRSGFSYSVSDRAYK